MAWAYIDFEFNKSSPPNPNLVCCCITTVKAGDPYQSTDWWLYNDEESKKKLVEYILKLKEEGFIFVAYAVEAEARCFLALGLDPVEFKWMDLFLEYRMLLNHNHSLAYGKQLIKGKVKITRPPSKNKYELTEEEKDDIDKSKPEDGLAAAVFKLLGKKLDTAFKDTTRSLILSEPEEFTPEERDTIIQYCRSDIEYLHRLREVQTRELLLLLRQSKGETARIGGEMLARGEFAARSAKMVSLGYPIDIEKTKAFASQVRQIIESVQTEINELFPDISPFRREKDYQYAWSQTRTKEWIATWLSQRPGTRWMRTKKGQYSLKRDAFVANFPFHHSYPKDNFGAQMVRFLTLKQNLSGFLPKKSGGKRDKRTFWDYVGPDGRVRPYFNIYGSQSARSQPSSVSFIPLKSAWLRVLISPRKGKAICGIDYSSQEFLLAALLSRDSAMLSAYEFGDPYLWFGRASGGIPKDGTKETHGTLRQAYKSTVLGLQYGMGNSALAAKLTMDTGVKYTEAQAKRLSDMFWRVFHGYHKYTRMLPYQYRRDGFIKLPCGWYMWKDNDNERSIKNVPVQGAGSSVMRLAVRYAQDAGLNVIYTLHDAIYFEYDVGQEHLISTLATAMDSGFRDIFKHIGPYEKANIRLEAAAWSPDYLETSKKKLEYQTVKGKLLLPTEFSTIYVDERGESEYEQFKKYLIPLDYDSIDI